MTAEDDGHVLLIGITVATNEERLIQAIRQMASFSVVDDIMPTTLHRIALLANDTIEDSAMVGVTMMVKGRPATPVFTDEDAPEIESAQYESGVGPCLDALRKGVSQVIPSTPGDTRWRAFSSACEQHGFLSTLSVPVIGKEPLGAITFYSHIEGAFDPDAETLATAFATQSAIVISAAGAYWSVRALSEQLTQALESRVVIEQAKGLLMSTGLSSSAAFDALRRTSQNRNRKLHDIAAELVADAERRAASA